ncbi:MAG TPA: lipocalin-like domain-containing protein [Chloroflexia bacterium]|nr:lipocalin-like domain-containing protein [Chloroflexia bacterium]
MLKSKLLGFWKLVSWEVRRSDGHITYPFGPQPDGLLVYGENDLMTVQLGDPRRPFFASNDRGLGTPEELKAAFEGYTAYFGRYALDEERSAVIHYPQLALYPNYTGSTQVRFIQLEGKRLSLSTNPIPFQGHEQVYVLVWEKID